ncbi:MAG TPA: TonB-dependent receptor plug domain-containing protein [Longimicrobiaceae bacterium]|nr:TonB-dependent receptor plug domain-containing protein [Longimicrobiaceae bacterium]
MNLTGRLALSLPGLCALLAAGCGAGPEPGAPAPETDAVSVGYGTQPRERVTGAVGSLTEEDFAGARVARIEELLQGRLAGVQVIRLPGGDFTLRIRGAGWTLGSGEPLVVIDGIPVQAVGLGRALDGIRPMDIARIDILKDAGSAAVYGARGANGVIVVTTRRRH